MTDFTIAQLATILSALAGKPRKPTTKAAAMRAIRRQAAAIGRTGEAVLAFSPGLLDGWLDPAAWREQLIAAAEPAVSDEQGELGTERRRSRRAKQITFRRRNQAGADRRPARAGAGCHAGRADRRHRLAAAHHQGGPHRPAPQGLRAGQEHAARTARPPTGSCRPTRRRVMRPRAGGLRPCRSIRSGRQRPRSGSRSCAISTSRPCRPAGTAARSHGAQRTCPGICCCGSLAYQLQAAAPWRSRSRHAPLPRRSPERTPPGRDEPVQLRSANARPAAPGHAAGAGVGRRPAPGDGARRRLCLERHHLRQPLQVARAITGTRWSGPRFFGLDRPGRGPAMRTSGSRAACAAPSTPGSPPTRGSSRTSTRLDAQREAAEAYIKSQLHEGWSADPDRLRRWRLLRRVAWTARPCSACSPTSRPA